MLYLLTHPVFVVVWTVTFYLWLTCIWTESNTMILYLLRKISWILRFEKWRALPLESISSSRTSILHQVGTSVLHVEAVMVIVFNFIKTRQIKMYKKKVNSSGNFTILANPSYKAGECWISMNRFHKVSRTRPTITVTLWWRRVSSCYYQGLYLLVGFLFHIRQPYPLRKKSNDLLLQILLL